MCFQGATPPQCLRAPTAILYQYHANTHTQTHTNTHTHCIRYGLARRHSAASLMYVYMYVCMYACIPGRLPCWPDRMRETEQSGAPEATRGGEKEGRGAGAKATGRGIKTCQGTPGRRGFLLCVCLLRETDRQREGPSLALFSNARASASLLASPVP